MRNGSTVPRILNLCTRRSATHLGRFTSEETAPHPRNHRREGYVEPRSPSGRFGEKIISGPSRDTNHNSSEVYPVAQSLYRARFLPKTVTTVNSNSLFSLYKHQWDKQKPHTKLVRLTLFTIIYITVYIMKTENKKRHSFTCNAAIVMCFLSVDVSNTNNNVYVKYM